MLQIFLAPICENLVRFSEQNSERELESIRRDSVGQVLLRKQAIIIPTQGTFETTWEITRNDMETTLRVPPRFGHLL
jgi:hypothetical protein